MAGNLGWIVHRKGKIDFSICKYILFSQKKKLLYAVLFWYLKLQHYLKKIILDGVLFWYLKLQHYLKKKYWWSIVFWYLKFLQHYLKKKYWWSIVFGISSYNII